MYHKLDYRTADELHACLLALVPLCACWQPLNEPDMTSVFPQDTIKVTHLCKTVIVSDILQDAAESLGLANLKPDVAAAVALDVDYRVQLVVQVGRGTHEIAPLTASLGMRQVHATCETITVDSERCQ